MDAPARPWLTLLPVLVAAVLLPALLGSSTTLFNDGDVSWHIATGRWILANRAIPDTDPFSLTWAGQPWVPIEWGSEVLFGGVFGAGGYAAVAALATLAIGVLHAVVFFNAARFLKPLSALGIVIAMDLVLIPMMFARPHLFAWALLSLWLWTLLRAREKGRAPNLAFALLMVLWANMHGSFVVGLALAAAFALEALIEAGDKAKAIRQWGLFGLASGAAVLVNANGFAGALHPFTIANLDMLPLIDEWKPSNLSVTPFFFAVLIAAVLIMVVRRPRLSPVRWLVLAGLLALALLQVRHQALLAIAAAMILPAGFAPQGYTSARLDRNLARFAGAGLIVVAMARSLLPLEVPESETNPWRLLAAVPADLRGQPVLNGYAMGGPLILAGVRPYIDGRADMYGDAVVIHYKAITDGERDALDAATDRWDLRWAILPHRYRKLLALLDSDPSWQRVAERPSGVVYRRIEEEAEPAGEDLGGGDVLDRPTRGDSAAERELTPIR